MPVAAPAAALLNDRTLLALSSSFNPMVLPWVDKVPVTVRLPVVPESARVSRVLVPSVTDKVSPLLMAMVGVVASKVRSEERVTLPSRLRVEPAARVRVVPESKVSVPEV